MDISGKNQIISQVFWMQLVIKGRQHLVLPIVGWASCLSCPVRFQNSLNINMSGRNQSIGQDFLHGDNHQRKLAAVTTSFWLKDSLIISKPGKKQLMYYIFCIEIIINPSRPYISESCIKIKINLIFYFHSSLWCCKRFYEGLKGIYKTF